MLVWERAHGLVLGVRRGVRKFPRTDRGSLKSQMTNAAESIAFNIVEGCGSTSSKEFARFLDISIKSTCELDTSSNSRLTAACYHARWGIP